MLQALPRPMHCSTTTRLGGRWQGQGRHADVDCLKHARGVEAVLAKVEPAQDAGHGHLLRALE